MCVRYGVCTRVEGGDVKVAERFARASPKGIQLERMVMVLLLQRNNNSVRASATYVISATAEVRCRNTIQLPARLK